ncbi:hypothetical protein D9757_008972 [Collybiopsis confluens]|uniref:F-box domain-containing protein n=1 Tax=Collybiopsis confluens TaxID=2823264 RepID=A0A8H5H348_9AGAR|nr:hypothetical protein D9757_008972 [Collybiopsis confluens]
MHPCNRCDENPLHARVSLDFTSLQDRLRSGVGPASVEPTEIATILKNVELDLEDYEAEIDRLEALASDLEARALVLATQKERLLQYASRVKMLLSPIRKLPDELLCDVFDLACGMNYFWVNRAKTEFSFRDAPAIAISSVCSRWRKNAMIMPSIWSRISLGWDIDTDDWLGETTTPLSLSLTRSLSWPLTIELDLVAGSALLSGQPHPIITRLTEERHRWQKLVLYPPTYQLDDLFLDLSSQNFPLLEDLTLEDRGRRDQAFSFWMGKAPNLKKLTLRGEHPLSEPIPTDAFPKITHIEYNPDTPDLESFLEANPDIISLALEEYISGVHTPQSRTCPRMESLTVRYNDNGDPDASSVFSSLHCPSLQSLHFEPASGICQTWYGLDSLMSFVQRSSFPLTTLTMKNLPLLDHELVYLLQHLPTLVNLTIDDSKPDDSPITEDFINSLHAFRRSPLRSSISPIIPRLRSLTLDCRATWFNDTSVVDMVKSRWIPSARSVKPDVHMFQVDCLREFTLKFSHREKVNSAVYVPLERLERSGMRAVVSWKPNEDAQRLSNTLHI